MVVTSMIRIAWKPHHHLELKCCLHSLLHIYLLLIVLWAFLSFKQEEDFGELGGLPEFLFYFCGFLLMV